jgi:hypothetical protein
MEKILYSRAGHSSTIWRMSIAGYVRIHTDRDTHLEYVRLLFHCNNVARTRLIVTHTYIACLVSIQQCRYVAIIGSLETVLLYSDSILLFGNVPPDTSSVI